MRKSAKKNKLRQYYRAVYFPLVYFAASFVSLCFIPAISKYSPTTEKIFACMIGTLFWLFLVLGLISVGKVKQKLYPLRHMMAKAGVKCEQKQVGLITFSRKKAHLAVYAICVLGLLLIILDLLFEFVPSRIMLPIISITAFAVSLHGIIDGKNYSTLKCFEKSVEERHESINE